MLRFSAAKALHLELLSLSCVEHVASVEMQAPRFTRSLQVLKNSHLKTAGGNGAHCARLARNASEELRNAAHARALHEEQRAMLPLSEVGQVTAIVAHTAVRRTIFPARCVLPPRARTMLLLSAPSRVRAFAADCSNGDTVLLIPQPRWPQALACSKKRKRERRQSIAAQLLCESSAIRQQAARGGDNDRRATFSRLRDTHSLSVSLDNTNFVAAACCTAST